MNRLRSEWCFFVAALIFSCFIVKWLGRTNNNSDDFPPKTTLARARMRPAMTNADREALAGLRKIIETSQEAEFRKLATVEFPEYGSGVPENYQVLVYSMAYGGWGPPSARQMRIVVQDHKAICEFAASSDIKTGELPFREVDLLVRQLVYGSEIEIQPKQQDGRLPRMLKGSSHPTRYTVEIQAIDSQSEFRFAGKAGELNCHKLDFSSDKADRFMHTRFCSEILKMIRGSFSSMPVAEQRSIVLSRLTKLTKEIELKTQEQEPNSESGRLDDELISMQKVLYGNLAITHGIAEAIPLVEKIGERDTAKKLAIASSADRLPKMIEAIKGDDHKLYNWAIHAITDNERNDPRFAQGLLENIENAKPTTLRIFLHLLRERKLTLDQQNQIQRLWKVESTPESAISITEFLLHQTQDSTYYDRLMTQANVETDDQNKEELKNKAADAIFNYVKLHGKRRNEAYRLLLKQLDLQPKSIEPSSFRYFELVERLGELGTADDLPRLKTYADHSSGYLSGFAIKAIAQIAPEEAERRAHERIDRFLKSGNSDNEYHWNVTAHYDLLFWRNSRSAVAALKRADAKLISLEDFQYSTYDDPATLLRYLEAETPAARVQAAYDYAIDRRVDEKWLNDVANELLKAGAPADKCLGLKECSIDDSW